MNWMAKNKLNLMCPDRHIVEIFYSNELCPAYLITRLLSFSASFVKKLRHSSADIF